MENSEKRLIRTNRIGKEETIEDISQSLNEIATCISQSLGPYGSTTIIQQRNETEHFMTKDGYTILKHLNYYHDIPKTVLDIVKKISRTLVRTVGDGSTSSIVIANSLYQNLNNKELERYSLAPQDYVNIFNELSFILEDIILKSSFKIEDNNIYESIKKIATISTNNDIESGELFAKIFTEMGRYTFINLVNSPTSKDYYEKVSGYEVNRGWINQRMANQDDKVTVHYQNEDIFVFMCNDTLNDNDMEFLAKIIEKICLKSNKPLVIIAPRYSDSFKAFFEGNLQRNKNLPLIAIDIDCDTPKGKNNFEDLAIMLNCDYYDKYNGDDEFTENDINRLGYCKEVIGNELHTIFINGKGTNSDKLKQRIEKLEEELNNLNEEDLNYEKYHYEYSKRIAILKGSMATLFVGGNSEMEKETRKFLMEDAVYACRSALEYGYIVGGNLIIPKIINNNDYFYNIVDKLCNNNRINYIENIFNNKNEFIGLISTLLKIVDKSFKTSFKNVLSNANIKDTESIINNCLNNNCIYNLKLRRCENDNETIVINSAQTDIEIMKATFSIISLLATSNQFIMVNPISLKEFK